MNVQNPTTHTGPNTARKLKLSIKDFFSKCDQIVIFTEKMLNGKLHFFVQGNCTKINKKKWY